MEFARVWMPLVLAAASAQYSAAVTLDAAYTTRGPSDDFCNPAVRASTFLTTDPAVWLYVSVSSASTGDRLRVDWIRPDGGVYDTSNFNPLTGGGGWCFDDSIGLAARTAAQFPGVWTIRGTWNGSVLFSLTFTLTTAAISGSNVIQNPGAEQSAGSSECSVATSVPGWTITGSVAVCKYGSAEIEATAPGPPDRGVNFFSGGPENGSSSLAQRLSVDFDTAAIDSGTVAYTLSGWLGGWDVQDDSATLTMTFRNASNGSLGTSRIGPVYANERPFGSGFVQKTTTGTLPAGTRSLDLVLLFTRSSGSYNDGAADNLSLVLGSTGGTNCSYAISPTSSSVAATGGSKTVQVTTTSVCDWTAASNASWISITAGSSGRGSGSVSYSVAANTSSSSRTGTLTIAGQTHTVTQAGGCTYALGSASTSVSAPGGTKSVVVIAPPGCAWTASSAVSWITITAGASGSGNGTVNFSVGANTAASTRSGNLTIAGQRHTVTQSGVLSGNTPTITSGGVLNAASYMPATLPSGAIALGSYFAIFGNNLGPDPYRSQATYPYADNLAGVTVTISKANISVRALPVFVWSTQINAIMPSNAPTGDVTVTVTYNGVAGAPAPAKVAASNFGIFNLAGGYGPGIIQNYVSPTELPLNTRSVTARPGQVAVLLGTGLGAISGPDNQPPPVGDLPVPVQVTVGGRAAHISYSGRMYGYAGVDMINFEVPADAPSGCSVPVQVKAGGTYSNTVTMAIDPQNRPCSDPQNPFAALTAAGGKIGAVILLRLSLLAQLDIAQPPLDLMVDLGLGVFEEIAASGDLGFNPLLSLPPVGACTAYNGSLDVGSLLGGDLAGLASLSSHPLDAGPSIAVTGPQGNTIALPPADADTKTGLYLGMLGGSSPLEASPLPPFLDSGTFRIAGSGGADVGAFQGSILLGSPVVWTNRNQIAAVNRAADLRLTWSGGDASKLILIVGAGSDTNTGATAAFFCFVPAVPGEFAVPASMLGNLPNTGSADAFGLLLVGSLPSGNYPTFTAGGLNVGLIFNATLSAKTVAFQ